jgi:hypothetical protein
MREAVENGKGQQQTGDEDDVEHPYFSMGHWRIPTYPVNSLDRNVREP